jgi:hypothetical protein
MSDSRSNDSSQPKKVGGEYGEIRSELDVGRLNRWLKENGDVKGTVKAPVVVKQFAVSGLVLLVLVLASLRPCHLVPCPFRHLLCSILWIWRS